MTIAVTEKATGTAQAIGDLVASEPETDPQRDKGSSCPPWCTSHAQCLEAQVTHCHFVEAFKMNVITGHYIDISVVQHEDTAGRLSTPTIYLGVRSIGEIKIVRLSPESAYLLASAADAAHGTRTLSNLSALLAGAGLGHLQFNKEDAGWMQKFPIALRNAVHTITECQRTPCPPWCVEEHSAPQDTLHMTDGLAVPLSRYPYWAKGEC